MGACMMRSISPGAAVGFLALAMACTALAQQAPREEGPAAGGEAPPRVMVAPLAFKVDWVRPTSQENTKVRYTPVQENVGDPNVEIKYYGAAKQILTTGTPGNPLTPYGVWSGTAPAPFAMTFRPKDSYVDLTGLATIRWFTKTSGFHVVRPVLKLANGNMLVGDPEFSSITMLTHNRFSLATVVWGH